MTTVQVTQPILPGSIVVLGEFSSDLGEASDEEDRRAVVAQLREAAGHDRFLTVFTEDAVTVAVLGPDDLADPIRVLLASGPDA